MRQFDKIINNTYSALPSKLLTEAGNEDSFTGLLRNLTGAAVAHGAFIQPNFDRKNLYVLVDGKAGLGKIRTTLKVDAPDVFKPNTLQKNDIIVASNPKGIYQIDSIQKRGLVARQYSPKTKTVVSTGAMATVPISFTDVVGYYNASNPAQPLPTNPNAPPTGAFNPDGTLKDERTLGIAIYNAFDAAQFRLAQTPPELPAYTIEQLVTGQIHSDKSTRGRHFHQNTPAVDMPMAHKTVMQFIQSHGVGSNIKYMKPDQLAQASKGGLLKRMGKAINAKAGEYATDLAGQITKDTNVWG